MGENDFDYDPSEGESDEDYIIDAFFEDAPSMTFNIILIEKKEGFSFKIPQKRIEFESSPIYANRPIINDFLRYKNEYLPSLDPHALEVWEIYSNPMCEIAFSREEMQRTTQWFNSESGYLVGADFQFEGEIDDQERKHPNLRDLVRNNEDLNYHRVYNLMCIIQTRLLEIKQNFCNNDFLVRLGNEILKRFLIHYDNMQIWYEKHPEKRKCPYSERCAEMTEAIKKKFEEENKDAR